MSPFGRHLPTLPCQTFNPFGVGEWPPNGPEERSLSEMPPACSHINKRPLRQHESCIPTFCFDSNHVLLQLEVRSASTRSTFCFGSNHTLFVSAACVHLVRSSMRFGRHHSSSTYYRGFHKVSCAMPYHCGSPVSLQIYE